MPSLGADMEEGTVAEWLVKPGDEVHRGDIVAMVETEKSTMEVEIFESGVIEELVVHEGESVPVGAVLAHVRTAPHTPPMAPRSAPTPPPVPAISATAVEQPLSVTRHDAAQGAAPFAPVPPDLGAVYSPILRHVAEQLDVDLATVKGTGIGGLLTRADVEHAAEMRQVGTAAEVSGQERAMPSQPGRRPTGPGPKAVRPPRSSPLARRLAAELGIDLGTISGTGAGGSIVERDVRRAAPAEPTDTPAPAGAGGATEIAKGRVEAMRHAIGALMARSKREIPHYYLSTTIDVGAATEWLQQANLERPVTRRLVLPTLLLKATALAVAKVPEMNGFFSKGEFVPSEAVHVGVAISLRTGGVIAPAIHDAGHLGLDELMTALQDLVGRARAGVLRASEMSDPTITVTNLGDLGVEAVFGVIYPPQVALVGFGRVTERAVAKSGMLGVRPCLTATLSADHRASDGHRGGRFLAEIDRLLQEPDNL